MVTIYSIRKNTLENGNKFMVELRGLSTDVKPTKLANGDIENGSVFVEMDTQDLYMFNSVDSEWVTPEGE